MNDAVRSKNVPILVTPKEKKRLQVLAALSGKTVSTFIYDLLLQHTELGNDSFFANGVQLNEQIDNQNVRSPMEPA